MPSSPLQTLAVVPLTSLVLHEAVEPRRAEAVRAGIGRSGVLTDPIVAAAAPDGRWLVLDGAHRTTALAALGVPAAVIQRMPVAGLELRAATASTGPEHTGEEGDAGAQLAGWAHDIAGIDPTVLGGADLGRIGRVPTCPGGMSPAGVAVVATVEAGGRTVVITSAPDLPSRLAAMWTLAGRYAAFPYTRRHPGDPAPGAGTTRVTWTPAQPSDLVGLAGIGATFPAGVSRFVVRGRVLGLRVPLAELSACAPGGAVDAVLAGRLLSRLEHLPVRLYQEPVWVVESAQAGTASEDPHSAQPPGPSGN